MKKECIFKSAIVLLFIIIVFISLFSCSVSSQKYVLNVTGEHPFLVNGSWISASQLKIGDLLITVDGKTAKITSIKEVLTANPFNVYNLKVDWPNDYFAGNVLVHNKPVPGDVEICVNGLTITWARSTSSLEKVGNFIDVKYRGGQAKVPEMQNFAMELLAKDAGDGVRRSSNGYYNGKRIFPVAVFNERGDPIGTLSVFESDIAETVRLEIANEIAAREGISLSQAMDQVRVLEVGKIAYEGESLTRDTLFSLIYSAELAVKSGMGPNPKYVYWVSGTNYRHALEYEFIFNWLLRKYNDLPGCEMSKNVNYILDLPLAGPLKSSKNIVKASDGWRVYLKDSNGHYIIGPNGEYVYLQLSLDRFPVKETINAIRVRFRNTIHL